MGKIRKKIHTDSINSLMVIAEADGTISYIDPTVINHLEFNEETVMSMNMKDILLIDNEDWQMLADEVIISRKCLTFERKLSIFPEPKWFEITMTTRKLNETSPESIMCILHDIDRYKFGQRDMMINEKRLESLLNLTRMTDLDTEKITDFVLEQAIRLTQSKVGFIALTHLDRETLTVYSGSESVFKAMGLLKKPFEIKIKDIDKLADIIHGRRARIVNNVEKIELPAGHIKLHRYLAVPLLESNRVVVLCGIGNKKSDYCTSDSQQVQLLLSGMWEILKRKAYEKALADSEARYRAIVEDQTELICRVDFNGKITFVNDACCQFFDMNRADIIGRSYLSMVMKEDRQKVIDVVRTISKENPVTSHEHRVILPDGEIKWQEWTDRAIFDDVNGEFVEFQSVGRDITRRKAAEDALQRANEELEQRVEARTRELTRSNRDLRESEARLRQITDNMSDIICQVNLDGRVTYVSPSITPILGYTPAEVTGIRIFDLLHPDDMESLLKVFEAGMLESAWRPVEFRYLHKNGHYLWFEATGRSNMWNDTVVGAVFGSREISSRRMAQEALIEGEAKLRRITDNMMDMISQTDYNGIYEYVSPSFKTVLGFEPERLMGSSCFDLVHSDDLIGVVEQFEKCRSEGISGKMEYRSLCGDGRYIWVESIGSPLFNDDGELIGAIFGSRDITDRKAAEEHLQLTSEVFDNVSEAIIVADSDQIVLSVNPAFVSITGILPEMVIGRKLSVLEEDILDPAFSSILMSMATGKRFEGTVTGKIRNGNTYTAEVSVNTIKTLDDKAAKSVIILRDITEQIKLREESQRLHEHTSRAEKMASMSAMSAGIVHEIAQPLNSIKVLADSILYWNNKGQPLETEKVMQKLSTISSQAGRIDEIIRHMRSFAVAGETSELWPCNFNLAIDGALNILGRQLSAHGIKIVKWLLPDLPDVLGNPNRFEEVVINLLVNAMHALDEVERTDKVIECRTYVRPEVVVLEVSDNGTGIPENILANIFEPFYSTKKSGDGMGLGLTIVQNVITSFNGSIEAFNNDSGGATFRIELPVRRY